MTAFASLDNILVALTTTGRSESIPFFKDGRQGAAAATALAQAKWTSLWAYNGTPGGTGAAPGAVATYPTNATQGSLGQLDPGGGRQKYLLGGTMFAMPENVTNNLQGKLLVYDRLAHFSGLSGTAAGAQTVNLNALTRYSSNADCVGNMLAYEINTALGATTRTLTGSYTNQAGTAGQATQAVTIGSAGFLEKNYMAFMPLASGDTGIKSLQSVTLSGSTLTAGDFSVVLLRPLMELAVSAAGQGVVRDLNQHVEGLREVLAGACLAFAWYSGITGTPQVFGQLQFAEN